MDSNTIMILSVAGGGVLLVLAIAVTLARFYRKVDQGRALIVNPLRGEPWVTFTGSVVWPIINRAEIMDISVKTIEIDRRGKDGLICKDNIRADISVTFFVKVNKTPDDVLNVAQLIGCQRASDQETIENLFNAKFSEALKTAGKKFDFTALYEEREQFRKEIEGVIGQDLNGFTLEDTAIDYLEQTPMELLDAENILDAEGIRKITEITAAQNIKTNELRQDERMRVGAENLKADEAVFEFEKRRAEAEAKKNKEISEAQAKAENEAIRVRDLEQRMTLIERQKHEEAVAIANEAKLRGVAVAEKNREREIAVEQERVEKARMLEQIARERETELGRIQKDKEVEVQKKEIADVVRGRIVVDKTVAEEEERIKDLRVVAEAKRAKEATVIGAEATAQEVLIKQVKAAEAQEAAAKLEAKQRLTLAEADLEVADKAARAKMRIAEGVQAETAAPGLAQVKVREANAQALEKEGLAKVRVDEANAQAVQKLGLAEAEVVREKLKAEATGEEEKGLAEARVKEATATAIERQGLAEAQAIEKKLVAEAKGLSEKAEAMKALDGVGREHEEFRIQLEKEKEVELAQIDAKKDIAHAQASVMAKAMESAKINIVGGDGAFFDRFVKAVSLGQSADGMIDNSETIQKLLGEYLTGNGSLPADLKEVLSRPALDSTAIRNLTISAVLSKFMSGADGVTREKLQTLIDRAKDMGLG
ncbi:MAG: SPFH domain-containing protein [Polyangiales bacterium]